MHLQNFDKVCDKGFENDDIIPQLVEIYMKVKQVLFFRFNKFHL